ncbi:uncharacterized protein LOC144469140 [Augochlora pura]
MGTFTVKVIRGRGMYRFIFGRRENIHREASDIKDFIDAVFVRDTGTPTACCARRKSKS